MIISVIQLCVVEMITCCRKAYQNKPSDAGIFLVTSLASFQTLHDDNVCSVQPVLSCHFDYHTLTLQSDRVTEVCFIY